MSAIKDLGGLRSDWRSYTRSNRKNRVEVVLKLINFEKTDKLD